MFWKSEEEMSRLYARERRLVALQLFLSAVAMGEKDRRQEG